VGLDQYVYKLNKDEVIITEDLLITECALPKEEIFYWRKFPSLQGWMNSLYFYRGGSEMFNNVPLLLEREDLLRFQSDFESGLLPQTSGFFFGNDLNLLSSDKHERELAKNRYVYTQEFVKTSLKLIDKHYLIVYDSSW
jgi:hypothetical protein